MDYFEIAKKLAREQAAIIAGDAPGTVERRQQEDQEWKTTEERVSGSEIVHAQKIYNQGGIQGSLAETM